MKYKALWVVAYTACCEPSTNGVLDCLMGGDDPFQAISLFTYATLRLFDWVHRAMFVLSDRWLKASSLSVTLLHLQTKVGEAHNQSVAFILLGKQLGECLLVAFSKEKCSEERDNYCWDECPHYMGKVKEDLQSTSVGHQRWSALSTNPSARHR